MHNSFDFSWNDHEPSQWSHPDGSTTIYASTEAYGNSQNPVFFQPQSGQSSYNEPQFFNASPDPSIGEDFPYSGSHSRSDADVAVPVNAIVG